MIEVMTPKGAPPVGARVRARLAGIFAVRGIDVARLSVAFVDENGPKGGAAARCRVSVSLPRRPALCVEHTATTPRLAFDGVLETLERRLDRARGRLRDGARRPKKYFAAGRLLTGAALGRSPG
jgi:ribosome-associated translation inhibitor RaiA